MGFHLFYIIAVILLYKITFNTFNDWTKNDLPLSLTLNKQKEQKETGSIKFLISEF